MKKMNILKIAFTLVLAISFSVAFGQAKDASLTIDNTVAHTVTINKAIPFYVTPDIYFNPGYVTPAWTIVSDFLWNSDGTLTGTSNPGTEPTYTDATISNPDITFTQIGAYVLGAQEISTDGCAGSIQLQSVTVIDVPDLGFTVADPADNCGDVAATDVLFNIAVNGETNYRVDWTYNVDNLAADQLSVTDALDGTGPSLLNLDATNTDDAFAGSGAALVLTNQAFPVLNTQVTRYTFTLTGINGAVSRVSDYIAPLGRSLAATNFTNYPVTGGASGDATFVLTVLPSPTTGPIYHLAN